MSRVAVAPKVAVNPVYGLEEDDVAGGEGGGSGFSPELKLFVGNLPFSVDSAELAGLFERAGNVEMVEVLSIFLVWLKEMWSFLCHLSFLTFSRLFLLEKI